MLGPIVVIEVLEKAPFSCGTSRGDSFVIGHVVWGSIWRWRQRYPWVMFPRTARLGRVLQLSLEEQQEGL